MPDSLGPVEVDFTIPADFGKEADAAIKKMAGLTDAATKMPKDVKAALLEEKEVIKTIEADIKTLEKALQTVAPGKAKQEIIADLGAAKQALEEEKAALKGLEVQTESTKQGSKRLSFELRDMQDQLAKMRLNGQQNTDEYRKMELAAAALSDELRDVKQVTRQLGDDQRTFKGMADGITGLAGAFSAGAGAVGLFAGENENLQRIQTRVQSLMAVTIGLQQVSSTLDKDSAFRTVTIVRLKELWITAEKGLTAALWGSNAAAKALMITATAGLAIAIPALIGWYSRLNEKQKEAAAKDKEAVRLQTDASIAAGKARMELDLTISKLERFNGSKEAEKRMIKEVNDKYGDVFGTYSTLAGWLDVLKTKAADYVKIMFLQARVNGLVQNMTTYDAKLRTAQNAPLSSFAQEGDGYSTVMTPGGVSRMYSADVAKKQQEQRKQEVIELNQKWFDLQKSEAEKLQSELESLQNKSNINTSFEDKTKQIREKSADDTGSYYIDLIDKFRSYQKQRIQIQNKYDEEIADLVKVHHDEEAEIARQARDKELKALDDSQPLAMLAEKYKTYDQQVKEIRERSNKEISELKAAGYAGEAEMAARAAQAEIEAIEEQKLKSMEEFKGLFEDVGSLTAEQIKKIIWDVNMNFDKLDPEQVKIVTALLDKLGLKLKELSKKDEVTDPFKKLTIAINNLNKAEGGDKSDKLAEGIKAAATAAQELLGELDAVTGILEDIGVLSSEQAEAARLTFKQVSGVVSGMANIGLGIISGDPASIVKGAIDVVGNAIKLLDFKSRKIAKTQAEVTAEIKNMERAYTQLDYAVRRSLGTDVYTNMMQQYKLNVDEMKKYQELIDLENDKRRKKRDQGKIQEWKDSINQLMISNADILNQINESLAQTNAKDFANDIATSIVSAFEAGTDATLAWGDVVDQVFRNAVVNALKLQFLEKPINDATAALARAMEDGVLTPEETEQIRKIIDEPARQFNDSVQAALNGLGLGPSDGGKENSLYDSKASFSQMKEETGSALLGQFTALRMSSAMTADIAREEQVVRKSMNQALQAIAENTSYCRKLEDIDRTLRTIETDGIKVR